MFNVDGFDVVFVYDLDIGEDVGGGLFGDLREFDGWTPVEMIGRTEFPSIGQLPFFLTLGPHSFFWFQLEPQAQPIQVHGMGEEADAHLYLRPRVRGGISLGARPV